MANDLPDSDALQQDDETMLAETNLSSVELDKEPVALAISGVDEEYTELWDGSGFNPLTASSVTCANPTQVVVLAGENGSGKTTLLASIYEKFQKSPFAGYIFAGSLTLPGFEKRCHLARIASQRSESDTERTKLPEGALLHLKVRRQDLGRPSLDLLFTDLSGERFRLARDSTEECKKLELLLRADHFVLLVDGALLVETQHRQEACVCARLLLRSCLDAEMLGSHSYVDVLFTKWDLVMPKLEEDDGLRDFLEAVEVHFKSVFRNRLARLRFFQVAARPRKGSELPFAYNLEKVFPSWVEDRPYRSYYESDFPYASASLREIDRFGLEVLRIRGLRV